MSEEALLAAALGCADEADFLAALRLLHGHGGCALRSLGLEVYIRNPALAYRALGVPGAVQRQRRLPGHRPRVGVEVGEERSRPCLLIGSEVTPAPQEVALGILGVES